MDATSDLEAFEAMPSVAERYDQADEDHDCGAEEVNMGVDVAD